ncbi:MAG: SulP family inorganic anion transporter [Ruminococcaceae bacterium]|nr:SulP family inorganic anion transporter [Oscillospiraceae bacterium]
MIKKFASDLRSEFKGYNGQKFSKDLMAGITVAAVALPLALAFGVSSGADATAGLITAIFAGIIIGILSGASYQISGPTGAMSAILISVSAKYGIGGVLTAGFISGAMLLVLAVLRTGKLVSYIPSPVITGFTSGIAVIIALGQIDNFFGTVSEGEGAIAKLISYGTLGFNPNMTAVLFGLLVVAIMIFYPKKWSNYVPSSLASIIVVLIINMCMFKTPVVAEVGSIPRSLIAPKNLLVMGIDFSNIKELVVPAFSIAALGMIESLLCGASAGKMKGEKIDATRELVAQGVGNMVIPLFGGVPATAAIARTSVAIKAGGHTRMVSVIHSVVLIAAMFVLSGVMSRIPLSALAGVLMVTAWRMNEWEDIKDIFGRKLTPSILQFLATMIATVIFDLTIAILVGIVVAMVIFILKSSNLAITSSDVDESRLDGISNQSKTKVMYLAGPMFFATQDKLKNAVNELEGYKYLILSMRGVPSVDDSAVGELVEVFESLNNKQINVFFTGLNDNVKNTLEKSGFFEKVSEKNVFWDAVGAMKHIEKIS